MVSPEDVTREKRDRHVRKGWYHTVCPICGGKHLWLGYNKQRKYFNCFNHGYSPLWKLLRAWFPGENLWEIYAQLDNVSGYSYALEKPEEEKVQFEFSPPTNLHPLCSSKEHIDYIRSRNLDPETLSAQWGVWALCDDTEYKYRNRIFVSVCDEDGTPVSWLTRSIYPEDPRRYLTAPKDRELSPIKRHLFGQHLVSKYDAVIVVEGIFDAFNVGRNVVATLGKKITRRQYTLISQYQRRIICFDNEKDTQEQAEKLVDDLSSAPGITDIFKIDAPDPGSAPKKEIERLLKFAELI